MELPGTRTKDMSTTTESIEEIRGAARIGMGEKLHRCLVTKVVKDPGTPWARTSYKNLGFTCRCPGCSNGSANYRATFVPGAVANCGG